jgi:hypothetical protein
MRYDSRTYHMTVDVRSGPNHSWIVSLLPFFEQQSLYKEFDFKKHVSANLAEPQSQQPAALLCPSDGALRRIYRWIDAESGDEKLFAKANYAAFTGPFHINDFDTFGAIRLYGQELREVTDGTSQTLTLSEVRTRDDEGDQRGVWALPWSGATLLSFDAHPAWYPISSTKQVDQREGFTFETGNLGATQTPNGRNPDVLYECPDLVAEQIERMPCTKNPGYMSAAPRSGHPVGVNSAYLDASVRFLSNDVDEATMAYLIATTDGHVVELP